MQNRLPLLLLSVSLCSLARGREREPEIHLIKGLASAVSDSGEISSLPLFFAVPDSLGPIPVRAWLSLTKDEISGLASKKNLQFKSLPKSHQAFMRTLLAVFYGSYYDARDEFVHLKRYKFTPVLKACIQNNKAVMYFFTGQPGFAEKEFLKLISKKHPWSEAAWRNLFSIYLSRGWYQKASELLDRALEEKPSAKWVQVSRGYLISVLGTQSQLEEFLKSKSSWKDSLYSLQIAYGRLLRNKHDLEGAIKYFTAGLEGDPKNGMAWLELSEIYDRQKYFKFASDCLHNALKAGINTPVFFHVVGLLIQEMQYGQLRKQMLIDRDLRRCAGRKRGFLCHEALINSKQREHDMVLEMLIRDLEEVVALAPHVRKLTQLLYYSYGSLGMKEHAENLMSQQWFHFEGQGIVWPDMGTGFFQDPNMRLLRINFTPGTFPLYLRMIGNDFFIPNP